MSLILASALAFAVISMQKPSITVSASPDIHHGDLILSGNNITTIEGRFDIEGSIIVKENATLILRNAIVNLMQSYHSDYNMSFMDPSGGCPRLFAENVTITSSWYFGVMFFHNSSGMLSETNFSTPYSAYLRVSESSAVTISGSSIGLVVIENNASLSAYHSTMSQMDVDARNGSPHAYTYNSTVEILQIYQDRVNCSFANIYPGFFDFWNSQLNTSTVIHPNGWFPNVTISHSTINDWAFRFRLSSNITISNSRLRLLACYTNTISKLINVTADQFDCWEGVFYVCWYLDVHVIDSIGQDVPSANVTVTYPNATVAESKLTGIDGWTRLTLMEKMMNDSGEYLIGNYSVEVSYETYSNGTEITMTENQIVTLRLEGFVVPELPSFILLPLFVTATLLAIIVYKRKQSTLTHYGKLV
jgi:hypothetical protein